MEVTSGFLSENGLQGNDSDSKPIMVNVGGPSSQLFNVTPCGVNESWPSILTSGDGGLPAADVDFRLAVDVYIVGALCAIGFFGNAFTVAVLRSDADGRDNSTNWLLQTLAFVDSVYLAACLFIQPLKALYDTDRLENWVTLEFVYPHIEPYIWPIASILQTLTVWIVLLVTVDRFVAVCRPLKRHFRSIERAKTAAGVGSLLAVVYNVPLFFERQVTPYHQCQTATAAITMTGNAANASSLLGGQTILAALTHNTPLGNSFVYFVVYKTACYFLFRSAGPLAIIAYINVRLLKALRLRRRRMAAHGRCRQQHGGGASVTAMLIAVVTIFVVCELPDLALRMTASLSHIFSSSWNVSSWNSIDDGSLRRQNDYHQREEFLLRANSVTNALLAFNSSVNFIVYCVVGNKFRDIFVRFCRSALIRCCSINLPACRRRNSSTENYISDGVVRDLATVGCGFESSGLAAGGMTSQIAEITAGTTSTARPRLASPATAAVDCQYAVHGCHRGHHFNHHHCGRHLSFVSAIPAVSTRRGTEGLVTLWPPLTRCSGQRGPFAPRSPTIDNASSSRFDKTHQRLNDRSTLSAFNRERVAPVCKSDGVESSASLFPVEAKTVTKAEVLRVDIAAALKRTENVNCNVDSGINVTDSSES